MPSQDKAIGKYIDSSLNEYLIPNGFKKTTYVSQSDFMITYNEGVITKEELNQTGKMHAHQLGDGAAYSASNSWYETTSNTWWTEKTQSVTLVIDIYTYMTKQQ